MVQLSTILIMALSMSLGRVVSALPQAKTNTTNPTTTSVSPAAASSIAAVNPLVFPTLDATKVPIPGASDNSTLVLVAPEVVVNKTQSTTKRDVEKRDECPDNQPTAPAALWEHYIVNFCDHYFPATVGTFWIPAGFCYTGFVPAGGSPTFYPQLNFQYCAKNPGLPYTVFVAVTNSICLSEFDGIVNYNLDNWFCYGSSTGATPGEIWGGDNFDVTTDSSNYNIDAS